MKSIMKKSVTAQHFHKMTSGDASRAERFIYGAALAPEGGYSEGNSLHIQKVLDKVLFQK
jgi:hypothetical protein